MSLRNGLNEFDTSRTGALPVLPSIRARGPSLSRAQAISIRGFSAARTDFKSNTRFALAEHSTLDLAVD